MIRPSFSALVAHMLLLTMAVSLTGCSFEEAVFLRQLTGQSASKPSGNPLHKSSTRDWRKKGNPEDNPPFSLIFTEGRQLIVTDGEHRYHTQFTIEQDPKNKRRMHISVAVKGLGIMEKKGTFGGTYPTQGFAAEILNSTGELLLSVSPGQYSDLFTIRKMAGVYTSTHSRGNSHRLGEILRSIDSINRQLLEIRSKDNKIRQFLPKWKKAREDLVQKLRNAGIRSLEDVEQPPVIDLDSPGDKQEKPRPNKEYLVDELVELVRGIERAEKKLDDHANLTDKLESAKRRLERLKAARDAGVFESEDQVDAILAEVGKELNSPPNNQADQVVEALDREQILERELAKY